MIQTKSRQTKISIKNTAIFEIEVDVILFKF